MSNISQGAMSSTMSKTLEFHDDAASLKESRRILEVRGPAGSDSLHSFMSRASSYRKKCMASRAKLLGTDGGLKSFDTLIDNDNNDDDFSESTAMGRRDLFSSPEVTAEGIVIHEDDSHNEEVDDLFVVEHVSLKPFLHSPSIDRKVLSLDNKPTPFVIQHIGYLYDAAPSQTSF